MSLDGFYEYMCAAHKNNFPEWRVGQFIMNFEKWVSTYRKTDIFYFSDDGLIDAINEFIDDCNSN